MEFGGKVTKRMISNVLETEHISDYSFNITREDAHDRSMENYH